MVLASCHLGGNVAAAYATEFTDTNTNGKSPLSRASRRQGPVHKALDSQRGGDHEGERSDILCKMPWLCKMLWSDRPARRDPGGVCLGTGFDVGIACPGERPRRGLVGYHAGRPRSSAARPGGCFTCHRSWRAGAGAASRGTISHVGGQGQAGHWWYCGWYCDGSREGGWYQRRGDNGQHGNGTRHSGCGGRVDLRNLRFAGGLKAKRAISGKS